MMNTCKNELQLQAGLDKLSGKLVLKTDRKILNNSTTPNYMAGFLIIENERILSRAAVQTVTEVKCGKMVL